MFCIEATCFPRISTTTAIHEMHVCHFPDWVIRFHCKTIKHISNRTTITTSSIDAFSVVHKQCIYWAYWGSSSICKQKANKGTWCILTFS
jgi:hypothetical protein